MELYYQPNIPEGDHLLGPDESRHCVKVLRHKAGDHIWVTDGKGFMYEAKIEKAHHKECTFSIIHKKQYPKKPYSIHLAFAPTKNIDRTFWVIEKSIEIGVDAIHFFTSFHSERRQLNQQKVHARAISAMKQSLKAYLPAFYDLCTFDELLLRSDQLEMEKYIAYIDNPPPRHLFHQATREKSYIVLIGPEGDFSADEVRTAQKRGFHTVSLGESRLRTETAAITACHTLHLLNE
jgi:16S rRNA (uracil1498-N3)-methyltransferase